MIDYSIYDKIISDKAIEWMLNNIGVKIKYSNILERTVSHFKLTKNQKFLVMRYIRKDPGYTIIKTLLNKIYIKKYGIKLL